MTVTADKAPRLSHAKGFNGSLRGGARGRGRAGDCDLLYTFGGTIVSASQDQARQDFLRGHENANISAFAVSDCGRFAASGCAGPNADVVVWDAKTLSTLFRFQEHDHDVCQLGFSPGSKILASMGNERDRKIFFIDVSTGCIIAGAGFDPKRPSALAWSPATEATHLVATAFGCSVTTWSLDPQTGQVSTDRVNSGSVRREVTALVFSSDGGWLFAGTASGDVVTVNVDRRAVQMVHHVCSLGVGALARGSDGSVIIGGGDGTLNVFDWENMRTEVPPPVLHGSITSLSVDHGDVVIAGTSEGDIFKVSDGLERAVPLLQTQRGELNHLCFDANDGSTFSSTSTDGSICVWSSRDRQLLHRLRKPAFGSATSSRVLDGFVLSGWSDGHLRRHDLAPGHPEIWVIPNAHKFGNSTGVSAMCLGARGDLVISGGMRGDIRVWDLASRGLVAQLKQHMGAVTAVRAFADNSHALSCSEDQSIKLWDFAAEKCLTSFVTKMGAIHDIDLVADQVQFVSVGKDRCLTFWDLREPRPTQVAHKAHAGDVNSVSVSPQAESVATGGTDGVVRLWDFRTGSAIASLPGHTGRVSTVTFSPDGSALLSASDNGSLVWWEL